MLKKTILTTKLIKIILLIFLLSQIIQSTSTSSKKIDWSIIFPNMNYLNLIHYSKYSNEIVYISIQYSDSAYAVYKCNITNAQSPRLPQLYTNLITTVLYDGILEIDQIYLIFYKQGTNQMEYWFENSTSICAYNFALGAIDNIIYSSINQQIYILMTAGIVYRISKKSFIEKNFTTLIILRNITQKGTIWISPDENMLAIGILDLKKLYIYSIPQRAPIIIWSLPFNSQVLTWRSDSLKLYIMNGITLQIYQKLLIPPFTQCSIPYLPTPSLSSPTTQQIGISLTYLQLTNQLLILSINPLNNLDFVIVYVSLSFFTAVSMVVSMGCGLPITHANVNLDTSHIGISFTFWTLNQGFTYAVNSDPTLIGYTLPNQTLNDTNNFTYASTMNRNMGAQLNLTTIGCIHPSQTDPNVVYVSAVWPSNLKGVKMYNISTNPLGLIKSFYFHNQSSLYTQILQFKVIFSNYLLFYTSNTSLSQIFNEDYSFYIATMTNQIVLKYIYVPLQYRIYSINRNGSIKGFQTSSIMIGLPIISLGIQNHVNQTATIRLSNDKKFMAFGSVSKGLVKIYLFSMLLTTQIISWNAPVNNTMNLVFSKDNQWLYLLDQHNLTVYTILVYGPPALHDSFIIMPNLDYSITGIFIQFFELTNQLFIIATNNSKINSISTILYDIDNQIVTNQIIEVNNPIFNVDVVSNTGFRTIIFSYYNGLQGYLGATMYQNSSLSSNLSNTSSPIPRSLNQKKILQIFQLSNITILYSIKLSLMIPYFMYVSFSQQNLSKLIRSYNLSTTPISPIKQYFFNNQSNIYEQVLQFQSNEWKYLLFYGQGQQVQIWTKEGGFLKQVIVQQTHRFLFVPQQQIIYGVSMQGVIAAYSVSGLLQGDGKPIFYINNNVTQKATIQLSSNNMLMAFGTTSSGLIKIYRLTRDKTTQISTWITPIFNTMFFTFKTDNEVLYLMDPDTLQIYTLYPFVTPYVTYSSFSITSNSSINKNFELRGLTINYIQATHGLFIFCIETSRPKIVMSLFYPLLVSSLTSFTYQTNSSITNVLSSYNTEQQSFSYSFYSSAQGYIKLYDIVEGDPLIITNVTGLANLTVFSTINSTKPTNYSPISQQTRSFAAGLASLSSLIDATMKNPAISLINSIPGSRTEFKPFFMFFANFDDFWLYTYHQRKYDGVLNYFFSSIQDIQKQKWSILPFQIIWGKWIGINSTRICEEMNFKMLYTNKKFVQMEGNGNGILLNSINFFSSNLYIILLNFLVLRLLFVMFKNFKFSLLIRSYAFFSFLIVIILQGNLQYMTYLFGFDMKYLVFNSLSQKVYTILTIIIYFLLCICGVSIFWMIRYFCQKKEKCFFDNIKSNINASWYMSIMFGIRNVALGFVHLFGKQTNQWFNLEILLAIQFIFLSSNVILLTKNFKNTFKVKTKQWISILATLLRILIIIVMYFSVQSDNIHQIQNISDEQNFTIFSVLNIQYLTYYMYMMIFSIITQLIILSLEIRHIYHIDNANKANKPKLVLKQKEQIKYVNYQTSLVTNKLSKTSISWFRQSKIQQTELDGKNTKQRQNKLTTTKKSRFSQQKNQSKIQERQVKSIIPKNRQLVKVEPIQKFRQSFLQKFSTE